MAHVSGFSPTDGVLDTRPYDINAQISASVGVLGVFFGVVLVMAAAGLWLVPGSVLLAEIMLIKLMLSMAFLLGGVFLYHAGREKMRRS